MKGKMRKNCAVLLAAIGGVLVMPVLRGHEFRAVILEMQQLAEVSPSSPCLARLTALRPAETIAVRWSTAMDANAVKILTQDQTADGKLKEIARVMEQSFARRTEENGAALSPDSGVQVRRVATPRACGIDGVNSICFDQADMAFTRGLLAITRVITADRAGIRLDSGVVSTQAGQILDTDIYFNPSNAPRAFATPAALAQNPKAYDLESILLHEWEYFRASSASADGNGLLLPCSAVANTFPSPGPTAQHP